MKIITNKKRNLNKTKKTPLHYKENLQENINEKYQCTYITHRREIFPQKWYYCKTCGLINNAGCCEACSKICHQGHEVEFADKSTSFFCDCGAGLGKTPCKCRRPVHIKEQNQEKEKVNEFQ